ncbi:MAG TPA: BBP7 family outer membrane beta-barrel protein [Thermoguttaceae bacterium]|nr:BBP7 family outer membrane beta-barrel protein [Thermoguttaceae bacterium]
MGIDDLQLFAPADMSQYGGGYRANEGFFFSFDMMLMWPSKPDPGLIGDPTTRRVVITPQNPDVDDDGFFDPGFEPQKVIESSTLSTGVFDSDGVSGQRYDFGFIEGHHGWLSSFLNIRPQTQTLRASDAHVVFVDAPFGSPPQYHLQGPIWTIIDPPAVGIGDGPLWIDDLQVRFDDLEARYKITTWGAELSYMYRMHPFHCGGILEWFVGARYMEIDDRFSVDARERIAEGDDAPPENIPHGLGDSWWENRVENHVVGPQVGLRWYRTGNRWTWSTEARFFSGFNQQNIKQQGLLGEHLNPQGVIDAALDDDQEGVLKISNMAASAFSHDRRFHEWSPAAELRVDLKYQLTRSVSAGVGWTGIWVDGIARAPNTIDYILGQNTVMGINDQNHEDFLAHGLNFRVELNR